MGSKPLGAIEEQKRVEKREAELSDILSSLTVLGDPYEEMDLNEKKRHALFLYYDKLKVSSCLLCMSGRFGLA